MKTSEIRQLTNKELEERISEEKNLFARMKINHTVSQLDNPLKIRKSRRIIARLNTELRQRQLAEKKNS